jgi:uncharacterized protein YdhG (YjbR/CyaY superfamily)
MARFQTVDQYIDSFPDDVRPTLEAVRRTIRKAAPTTAEEGISYGIAAVSLEGRFIVWFAGWKRYISLYPIPSGDAALNAELAPYLAGRGTLKFPLGKPIPFDLIGRVTAELVRERRSAER